MKQSYRSTSEAGSIFIMALAAIAAFGFIVYYFVTDYIKGTNAERAQQKYDYWHPKAKGTPTMLRGPGGYEVTFYPNLP